MRSSGLALDMIWCATAVEGWIVGHRLKSICSPASSGRFIFSIRPLALSNVSEIAELSSEAATSRTDSMPGVSIKRIVPDAPDGSVVENEKGWGYVVVVGAFTASGL